MADRDLMAAAAKKGIPDWLMQIYNALPDPPQGKAPIDTLLPYLANPVASSAQLGAEVSGGGALEQIVKALGRGPAAAMTGPAVAYDQFGEPVESTHKTAWFDEAGRSVEQNIESKKPGTGKYSPKQIRIDPTPQYPPPGLNEEETIAWALANPPPPDQRLPEAADEVVAATVEANETIAPKEKKAKPPEAKPPEAKPKAKPKQPPPKKANQGKPKATSKKTKPLPWHIIEKGLKP